MSTHRKPSSLFAIILSSKKADVCFAYWSFRLYLNSVSTFGWCKQVHLLGNFVLTSLIKEIHHQTTLSYPSKAKIAAKMNCMI